MFTWLTTGLALGMVFQLIKYPWSGKSSMELKPSTEALGKYPQLMHHLLRLQYYRYLHESNFVSMVENIDRYLHFITESSGQKHGKDNVTDRACGFKLFKQAVESNECFYEVTKSNAAKEQLEVHVIYIKIYNELQSTWSDFMIQTSLD